MITATDQKPTWDLGETVKWICSRDHDRVVAMWDMDEAESVATGFFHPGALPTLRAKVRIFGFGDADALERSAVRHLVAESWVIEEPRTVPSERVLKDVMRGVQMRHLRMTMIRGEGDNVERITVAASDAGHFELRLTGDPLEPVLVWSLERQSPAGRSPRFSRADVVRSWPERLKKTVAATAAILRYLAEISTPEAPLTKAKACERCLAEVPNAYFAAFEKAWRQLEPSRKRGRGKHGPRAHR
jgi:hypothetical protein